ncbi:hypothetical protein [Flavobacterium anhuiense]|uniref:hypothetical protein n=1 Tax=Flavobacterium anhuiense TaxID=459526 RepID=UPI003D98F3F0
MNNFTIIDYKNAIRLHYKIAMEKDVSGTLSDLTPAQLRDFYLRLAEKGLSEIDKKILELFFGAKENLSLKKAIENFNVGKLKAIINFLEGTNTENRTRIEMAAILVDFQHRPYRDFEKFGILQQEDLIENDKNLPFSNSKLKEKFFSENETKEEGGKDIEIQTVVVLPPQSPKAIKSLKEKLLDNFKKKLLFTGIAIGVVFAGTIIGTSFLKKDCMTWVNDHYEKIERSEEGFCETYYDARYFNLKKIAVCDTTAFFDTNGKAKVFYIKVGNSIECFNQYAPYPENTNKFLRPITKYMIDQYLTNRPKCD